VRRNSSPSSCLTQISPWVRMHPRRRHHLLSAGFESEARRKAAHGSTALNPENVMAEVALEDVVCPLPARARVAKVEFEPLVKQNHARIVRLAIGMLRDPELAQDVAQETFVRAFRFYRTFRNDSAFFTWLYRIAVNLCLDIHQKAHVRETESVDAVDEMMEPEDPSPGPERVTELRELARRVDIALEALSLNHKAILILRESEGLSYEEISEVLRIPTGTVMSRLFHARVNLQRECARLVG